MNHKLEAQVRAEAKEIIARSGLTQGDLLLGMCPDELVEDCINQEYAREVFLRLRPEALLKGRELFAQHGYNLRKKQPNVYMIPDEVKRADGLARAAFDWLVRCPDFPEVPFLKSWQDLGEAKRKQLLADRRSREKELFQKAVIRRARRNDLGECDSRLLRKHEIGVFYVNWRLIKGQNVTEVGRAMLRMKPDAYREKSGKRASANTALTELRVYRLCLHLSAPQTAAYLTGVGKAIAQRTVESKRISAEKRLFRFISDTLASRAL